MMLKPESACLVIADISGYTSFLAGAELDHAQDILADLLSTVVTSLRPLRLAKLEGDAVFAYQIADSIDGPGLQDTIERSYFAFQRRLRDIRQSTSCECNACVLVPRLDLKLVVHYGQVIRQRIGTSEELVGSDVIVVHRLLKAHVEETTGIGAYALYTDACLRAMGLDDPAAAGMVRHREEFEGVGEVDGWVVDLRATWTAELERARLVVEARDALKVYEATLDAPRAMVWEYVTSPAHRPNWQHGVISVVQEDGAPGRRGVGTVNHCIHGKDAIIEEVLDWQPIDYVTYRTLLAIPHVPKLLSTYVFTDAGEGRTRVEIRIGRPKSAKDRAIVAELAPTTDVIFTSGLAALEGLVANASKVAAAAELPAEPDLPASRGRNLTEPVASTP